MDNQNMLKAINDLTEQIQTGNLDMLSNQAEIQTLLDKNTEFEQINNILTSEKKDFIKKHELEMQQCQNEYAKKLEEKDFLLETIKTDLNNSKLEKNLRIE